MRRALASWAFYTTKLRIEPILQWVYVNEQQAGRVFQRRVEVLPMGPVFPESVWAKGSSNSGGPSSHLVITSSHLHIFLSSHLLFFFTSSHLHTLTPSHLHIWTSSDLHIFSSSHLHVFIFTSSHLRIFTSSHLHIFSSCLLALLPPCPLAFLPSCPLALLPSCLSFFSISLLRREAVPTRHHEMQPFCTKWGSIVKNWGKIAI